MLLTRRILLLALASASACQVLAPSGPSNVAQGRYYSTGDPEYDDFFLRLFRLQIKLKDAPPRVGEPRQQVAEALNVGPDPEEIRTALAKRASELNGRGIRYSVAHTADPNQPPTLVVTGNPTGNDFALKGMLEKALKSAGELAIDLAAWQKELDELAPREATLEGNIGEAFAARSESERTEIKSNLVDGSKIIALLVERTRDLEHATTDFLKALGSALGETQLSTAASEVSTSDVNGVSEKKSKKSAPPPKPQKASPAPRPKAQGGKPAPKPAATPKPAAAPAPKPVPAPKPAKPDVSEAPAPPKPTQGTAKPDFEP